MDPMNEAFFFFLWHTALDFFSGHHPTCLNTATLVVPIFGRISTPPLVLLYLFYFSLM